MLEYNSKCAIGQYTTASLLGILNLIILGLREKDRSGKSHSTPVTLCITNYHCHSKKRLNNYYRLFS